MALASDRQAFACQTCRARHLQCDQVKPVCGQCAENERQCVPGFNVRFRCREPRAADAGFHSLAGGRPLTFTSDQVWITLPQNLAFVDETQSVALEYDCDAVGRSQPPDVPSAPRYSVTSGDGDELGGSDPSLPDNLQTPPVYETLTSSPVLSLPYPLSSSPQYDAENVSQPGPSAGQLRSMRVEDLLCRSTTHPTWQLHKSTVPPHLSPRSPLYSSRRIVFENRKYAILLRHFQIAIGKAWFDVTDPSFSTEVLRLAPFCPVLLYSLLALSAVHMNRVSSYDVNEAEEYHEKCVELLIPMLDDEQVITDGAVLASSVLLRFYEEMSAPIHGRDYAWHLLGGVAFVAAMQKESRRWEGLRDAALWVHQRQDVFNAILNQRPTRTDLSICNIDRSMNEASDEIWAKRSTCLTADVVSFCFGAESSSIPKYMALKHQLHLWDTCKPPSFTPLYYRECDAAAERYFPEVWLTLDACVVGLAYFHLSMLLMAVHDPTQPKIGAGYVSGRKRIQNEVFWHVRMLCGLAKSNPVPPGRVVACLAISEWGAWFTDPHERARLLDLLRFVERQDAWPCESTIESLKQQWELVSE